VVVDRVPRRQAKLVKRRAFVRCEFFGTIQVLLSVLWVVWVFPENTQLIKRAFSGKKGRQD
jgi:hypothetical protein